MSSDTNEFGREAKKLVSDKKVGTLLQTPFVSFVSVQNVHSNAYSKTLKRSEANHWPKDLGEREEFKFFQFKLRSSLANFQLVKCRNSSGRDYRELSIAMTFLRANHKAASKRFLKMNFEVHRQDWKIWKISNGNRSTPNKSLQNHFG